MVSITKNKKKKNMFLIDFIDVTQHHKQEDQLNKSDKKEALFLL